MKNSLFTGIDLSKWNGTIQWDRIVNKNLNTVPDFVILKAASTKTAVDPKFEENYAAAKKAGLRVGAYYYSEATTEAGMLKDAERFYSAIKDKSFDFPIYLDYEEPSQMALGQARLETIIKVFTDYFENKGYFIGLYSSESGLKILSENFRKKYSLWCARVGKEPSLSSYDMWQYSWKGKFNGINVDVDMNYCYKDFSTIIKKNHLNNCKDDNVSTFTTTTAKVQTRYTDFIPKNITFKTSQDKNVIITYKNVTTLNTAGRSQLSNHFQVKEFMSKSGLKTYSNEVKIHNKLIEILEALYAKLDCSKIIVNSGYRTKEHDLAVGGDGFGQHTLGRAADIVCYNKNNQIISAKQVCCALEDMGGVWGIGYISANATHVDTREQSRKWWGDETRSGAPNISRLGYNSFHDYFGI